jgi:hypothetical protein
MKNTAILMLFILISGCSSESAKLDSPSPVLEPVDPVAEELPIEAPIPLELKKLEAKLAELGYEGVGIDVETPEVIAFLLQVFSNSAAANRKIKSVYTGGVNDYDAAQEAFTVGSPRELKTVLAFLKKKVPVRKTSKKP